MIHQLNQPIPVPEETIEWANIALAQKKSPPMAFGLAVDDMCKHKAMRELQCTIPPRFAHYDLQMGDLYVEIKSVTGSYFTFSDAEYQFIREHVKAGGQYKILFYVNDIQANTTTYIGSLDASYIFEEGLFQGSFTVSGVFLNSWYLERLYVEKALKHQG